MRARKAPRRETPQDPIYNSKLVTKIINKIMRDGKKTVAEGLFYKAMDSIEKAGKNPMTVLDLAITNVAPRMEVRPRRVGGASYQVPVEVRGDRRESLAIRWIIGAARSKPNKEFKTFSAKFAAEILAASEGQGIAVKRKEDTLKAAEANRAFSHFKW